MPFWLAKGFIGTLYFQVVRGTHNTNLRSGKEVRHSLKELSNPEAHPAKQSQLGK